jgi:N-acetylglucosaminyldiphosphoundecaprenol N-acetyl-beta-D-mannosaminyltransferase
MVRHALGPACIDDISREQASDLAAVRIATREPSQIVTLNSLMFNAMIKDPDLRKAVSAAALVIPDSVGIQWAAKMLCGIHVARITGIDFVYDLVRRATMNGWRVFLLGSKPGVAESAAKRLRSLFPGLTIVGTHHGYFTDHDAMVAHVRGAQPDLLFAGLAMPDQELWISTNLLSMNVPVVMGVGGSFDVISGALKRAPVWMQAAGLEWLFRLLRQPWRIKRMLDLPVFVYNVVKLKLKASN